MSKNATSKQSAQKSPRKVRSKTVFEGRAFTVTLDEIEEPGLKGKRTREVVRHGPSSVILALDDAGRVLMVRQYRHAAGLTMWELPAGGVDEGETPAVCAKRELIEETGYRAKRWKKLVRYFPSPGMLDEDMHVYLATGLQPGETRQEEDESITSKFFTVEEIEQMIRSGRLLDGKTLAAWTAWGLREE